jgi:hypothetical protein
MRLQLKASLPTPAKKITVFLSDSHKRGGASSSLASQLKRLFRPFGVRVYSIPSYNGSDTYGFFLSRKMLDRNTLRRADRAHSVPEDSTLVEFDWADPCGQDVVQKACEYFGLTVTPGLGAMEEEINWSISEGPVTMEDQAIAAYGEIPE